MRFKSEHEEIIANARISFLKQGIVHIHYLAGNNYSLADNKKIFDRVVEMTGLKKVKILISGGDFVTHDADATKYNASEEVMSRCAAVAMITQELADRLVANFFLKFYKPVAPIRFFSGQEDALVWLEKFENQK